MSLDPGHVLSRAQTAAQALMVDTCLVQRVASQSTDPDTGVITYTYSTVYAGPCKVQQRAAIARPEVIGEAAVFMSRLELHVPVSVTGIASDDRVSITASAHDPDLLGRVWHIRELAHKSLASARRYSIVEVTS